MLAMLFYNPMVIPWDATLWLLAPLCAAVAIVYKTVRINDVRRLPLQTAILLAYMMGGLSVLGAVLWLILKYWP